MALESRDIQRDAVLRLMIPLLTALSRALLTTRSWAKSVIVIFAFNKLPRFFDQRSKVGLWSPCCACAALGFDDVS